jgi:hypothetical protein
MKQSTLSGYINSKNNRYWSTEYPCAVYEVNVQDVKVGECCTIGDQRIVGPISFHETNYKLHVRLILTPSFDQLTT